MLLCAAEYIRIDRNTNGLYVNIRFLPYLVRIGLFVFIAGCTLDESMET